MNRDIEELVKADAEANRVVGLLRHALQAHVAAGFSARVMAEIHEQRRFAWLSAPSMFAAAASIVALIAIASIFSRPVPKPSISSWVAGPCTVRLAPYNPAEWYSPLVFDDRCTSQTMEYEPLCTREALASCSRGAKESPCVQEQ